MLSRSSWFPGIRYAGIVRRSSTPRSRWYSSIVPPSVRSPVTSATAGRGCRAFRWSTARSRWVVVRATVSILLPGAATCGSLICAMTIAGAVIAPVRSRVNHPRDRIVHTGLLVAGLQRCQELVHALLGVAEQHHRLRVVVELVLDAREARIHAPLEDDDRLPAVDLEDRHPVERARAVRA